VDNWEFGLINLDEKKPLEARDREFIIFSLDKAYEMCEPLASQLFLFEDFEITRAERNQLILESEFRNDEKLVSTIILFG
jgi:hypothetical protein